MDYLHTLITSKINVVADTLGMTTCRKMNKVKTKTNKPWYNEECYKAKNNLKEAVKAFRNKGEIQERENYVKARKQNRNTVKYTKKSTTENYR